jgi:hypothetical protein
MNQTFTVGRELSNIKRHERRGLPFQVESNPKRAVLNLLLEIDHERTPRGRAARNPEDQDNFGCRRAIRRRRLVIRLCEEERLCQYGSAAPNARHGS